MSNLKKIVIFIFILTPVVLMAIDSLLYQSHFPAREFQSRWNKIFDRIGKNAFAIVQGAPGTDGFKVFRQSNEFYYLCGLETPHAYIVLDGRNRRVSLYLPHRDEARERNEEKLYIRIEDLIVVTETGAENLSKLVPSKLEDIEKLIKEKGILQMRRADR